mmetsp:Transcript_21318/g.70499  ORF Transcript_21318/g.70499 Transcript_21318/m.70499 type:complete len:94 (-) Transcript_21318:33-314(-)
MVEEAARSSRRAVLRACGAVALSDLRRRGDGRVVCSARSSSSAHGGVVDEVVWKVTEGDEAHVRAYEIMWANGDCNRISVTHVRHPVPGTPAG